MSFTAMVITISDRCAQGQREDASGPLLVQLLQRAGYTVTGTAIVPDEYDVICHALRQAALANTALILTTGGTGFSPRDITPEATAAVCQRMAPGIGEAMRAASLRITPRGMLSRATAGLLDRSLIVNLPGSPKAAQENLEAVLPSLAHGLEMLRGGQADCATLN
ncbi:MAG: MogA/MoaB family molybdenum cofactor biosynthesis protein [Oscillospiraceae bacterium]|nr:MogA/MoaB family molybdenum cofactor biosynthesis protein [Oscillospiraceae bacterium]